MVIWNVVKVVEVDDESKLHFPYVGDGVTLTPGQVGEVVEIAGEVPMVQFEGVAIPLQMRHKQVEAV